MPYESIVFYSHSIQFPPIYLKQNLIVFGLQYVFSNL